jgi:hypothetical protein
LVNYTRDHTVLPRLAPQLLLKRLKEARRHGPMQNIVKSVHTLDDVKFLLSWEMVQVRIKEQFQ